MRSLASNFSDGRAKFRQLRHFHKLLPICVTTILILYPLPISSHPVALYPDSGQYQDRFDVPQFQIDSQRTSLCSGEPTSECFLSLAQTATLYIKNDNSQDFARLFIAIAQAETKAEDSALTTIASINNPFLRSICLTIVAKSQLRLGNIKQGRKIAIEALENSGKSHQAYVNAWLYTLGAEFYAELGQNSQAKHLINRALGAVSLVPEGNTRAELLSIIALAQIKNGDRAAAIISAQNALRESSNVSDHYLRSLALSFISITQHRLGLIEGTLTTMVLAEKSARKASFPSKIVALAFLSTAQAKTEKLHSARNTIHETASMLPHVKQPYYQALAYAFLAQAVFMAQ